MLKISQAKKGKQSVTLQLEGRMVGLWVGEVRGNCEKIISEGQSITLELASVSFVDQDGVKFLQDLKSRGVKLMGCSLFLEEQLKSAPKDQV